MGVVDTFGGWFVEVALFLVPHIAPCDVRGENDVPKQNHPGWCTAQRILDREPRVEEGLVRLCDFVCCTAEWGSLLTDRTHGPVSSMFLVHLADERKRE